MKLTAVIASLLSSLERKDLRLMFDNTNRIELHFHSKAGGNATMYPREIIKFFSEAQMPAFAVTDESNIGAYPELETEWETGKYSARPIYGMEVLLKDKEDETDCVSLLIRNEDGRKRLYKLISENESNEPYPLFRFERFVEEREGFLLGSGPANGRLYKSVMQGHGKDEIRKEISVFDYVEVLPGKKYESVNRTIIEICDELKIPVVAICDARYADNLGKKALKVMKHWNKKDEEAPDNLFLNTEEMLEAFSYLPEEKAYEIVVTNTHLIANMCETVSVCPKKDCFPTVPNAKNRLKEKCFALLAEKYTDNYMAARDRVDWELSAIEKTGREFCFFQIKELLDMSNLTADDISLRGTASGSIIAYLLGISNIDPLKFGLEPEIIYGIDGERAIDININIPTSMHSEVVRNVGKLEGIGKYVLAGAVNTVSDTLARAMIERYMEENETYFDEDEFSGLVQMICGNYRGRGKHTGGVVVFPSECNYSEITPIAKLADGSEITYFDYYSVDRAFIKYSLLKHDSREMLTQLEKMTGVELSTVPVDSDEVIDLFSVDADGNVSGCEDLPEFESNYVKK